MREETAKSQRGMATWSIITNVASLCESLSIEINSSFGVVRGV